MPKQHHTGPVSRCPEGGAHTLGARFTLCLQPLLQRGARRLFFLCCVFSAVLVPQHGAAGTQPDVHLALSSNIPLASLSQKELAAIFLGQKRHWEDGTRVKIAILKSAASQDRFLGAVAGRTPGQYWAHWRNIVFSGRGVMPKIFNSEKEVLEYLAQEEGVVGQITSTELATQNGAATYTIDGVMEP